MVSVVYFLNWVALAASFYSTSILARGCQKRRYHDDTFSNGGSTSSDEENAQDENSSEINAKRAIFDAALDYVHVHGWSVEALAAGAEQQGFPSIAHGLFPNGGAALVNHFYQKCNEELVNILKEIPNNQSETDIVRIAIKTRLQMNIPFADSWPQALALMAHPSNSAESCKNIAQLSDDIAFIAGDRSTQFSWYTKRFEIATLYTATELYMLSDHSEDYEHTWNFLGQRLQDIQSVKECLNTVESTVQFAAEFMEVAAVTAKTMTGIRIL